MKIFYLLLTALFSVLCHFSFGSQGSSCKVLMSETGIEVKLPGMSVALTSAGIRVGVQEKDLNIMILEAAGGLEMRTTLSDVRVLSEDELAIMLVKQLAKADVQSLGDKISLWTPDLIGAVNGRYLTDSQLHSLDLRQLLRLDYRELTAAQAKIVTKRKRRLSRTAQNQLSGRPQSAVRSLVERVNPFIR